MDEFVGLEDEILKFFGLTPTEENQVLIQNLILGKFSRAALYASYSLLNKSAFNVLPRMGISNHEYQIYLYNLILQHPELIVELYNERMRAEPFLNEISITKGQYERLLLRNIRWSQPFLEINQSEILREFRVELN